MTAIECRNTRFDFGAAGTVTSAKHMVPTAIEIITPPCSNLKQAAAT
jgi:hypothetical protein